MSEADEFVDQLGWACFADVLCCACPVGVVQWHVGSYGGCE